jgi:hypothetical protein
MSARFLAAVLGLLLAVPALAQAPDTTAVDTLAPGPWKVGSKVGLGVTQSSYTSNWSGGDRGSMAWVLTGDVTPEKRFTRKYRQTNRLALSYGQTSQQVPSDGDPNKLVWNEPVKSSDYILFEHLSLFTLGSYLDPYFGFHLDSQFRDLSNPIGEINFNPIKLKETVGIARVIEKTEKSEFITRLGFGCRQTFGKSFADPVTKEKVSFSSNDGGFEWQTTMKHPVLQERVLYEGGLLVFAPLFYSKSDALQQFDDLNLLTDDVAGYWQVPDVNFINSFTTNVTKVITVNLLLHFVYDKFDTKANVDAAVAGGTPDEIARNIRKAGQFKQVLSLGLTYNLF